MLIALFCHHDRGEHLFSANMFQRNTIRLNHTDDLPVKALFLFSLLYGYIIK